MVEIMKKVLIVALCMILMFCFVSCGQNNAVTGEWYPVSGKLESSDTIVQQVDKSFYVEFMKNGKIRLIDSASGNEMDTGGEMSYTINDDIVTIADTSARVQGDTIIDESGNVIYVRKGSDAADQLPEGSTTIGG